MRVVLPAPVSPTIAVCDWGGKSKLKSYRMFRPCLLYEKVICDNRMPGEFFSVVLFPVGSNGISSSCISRSPAVKALTNMGMKRVKSRNGP